MQWCDRWGVTVNTEKSQIMHFRAKNKHETEFIFNIGNQNLAKVVKYKYLGLFIDYSLNYKVTAEAIAKSANRALGLLIAKSKCLGGLPYNCFSKLYEITVIPIVRYGTSNSHQMCVLRWTLL